MKNLEIEVNEELNNLRNKMWEMYPNKRIFQIFCLRIRYYRKLGYNVSEYAEDIAKWKIESEYNAGKH